MLLSWLRWSASFALALSSSAPVMAGTNLIQQENAKPGDPSWVFINGATNSEIEGYGSASSINRGESITFYVNTASSKYTLEIFRIGWYGGAGARKMMPTTTLPGIRQSIPTSDPTTGLIECQWVPSFVLQVPNDSADPTDWMSGVYLAKLTALDSSKQSYILFVVRDDSRTSDLLFQNSVATYEAYNSWGGMSLYTNPRAYKVSFNRPFIAGGGAADFISWRWENHMLRFLEREGFDVSYTTDLDTHARGDLLLSHKALLIVGHDEYWSWQMRDNVERAREHGVSLGFFGANTAFWQVRFEPSLATGTSDRTMVCYKSAKLDPITTSSNPLDQRLATTKFRLPPVNRPEDTLVGVMYESANIGGDLVVSDSSAWVFEGTGLQNGDHLPGLLGYEADRVFGHAPRGIKQLAHSPYEADANDDGCSGVSAPGCTVHYADMTAYEAESGATVVATGTMHWNWGLDKMAANPHSQAIPAVQQTTRNILNRFLHPLPYYLEPPTLSFPPQLLGSKSAPQEIVIVNNAVRPLPVYQLITNDDFSNDSACPSILFAHQRCVVSVSFAPRATGTLTGNEIFNLSANLAQPLQVQLTGTGVNYDLHASPQFSSTATVAAGRVAEFDLALGSSGFSGTVALSCGQVPPDFECSVTPSSVVLSEGASSEIMVTVRTPSEIAGGLQQATGLVDTVLLYRELALILVVLLLMFTTDFTARRPLSLLFPALLLVGWFCTSCTRVGNHSTDSAPAVPNVKSYQLAVDATSDGVMRSASLQLNVEVPRRSHRSPFD